MIGPVHWDLQFDFECPQLSDALGLSDIKNLFTILISISPHHVFKNCEKQMLSNGSPRTYSSALSHSIDAGIGVELILSCGNDVGNDVPDDLDEKEVVDKPETTIAT